MPGLVEVARRHAQDKPVVLTVSYDVTSSKADRSQIEAQVAKFVEARQWGLPVLIYDSVDKDSLNERLNLPGPIPATLAFDKDGREVDREEGESTPERFEELMRKALGR